MSPIPEVSHSHNPLRNRTPIQNSQSGRYFLLTLVSFAFSVSATRLFLELAGYPQIGGGNLHIAHVLWGGLLLFIACLLPLALANGWARDWSAILAGLGMGLFMDEVGKFITANNDYFYASAAPIIYTFFLLIVLVAVQLQAHRKSTRRAQMYAILNDLTEVLDEDLSQDEKDSLLARLDPIAQQKEEPELSQLAQSLIEFLGCREISIVPKVPNLFERMNAAWQRFEDRRLKRRELKGIIVVMLILWAGWAIFIAVGYLVASGNAQELQTFVKMFLADRVINSEGGLDWVATRVVMEGATGILGLASVILLLARKERLAVELAYFNLLIVLTVINLVIFYFDQFSTILFAVPQFILLMLVLRYRDRFLKTNRPSPEKGA